MRYSEHRDNKVLPSMLVAGRARSSHMVPDGLHAALREATLDGRGKR